MGTTSSRNQTTNSNDYIRSKYGIRPSSIPHRQYQPSSYSLLEEPQSPKTTCITLKTGLLGLVIGGMAGFGAGWYVSKNFSSEQNAAPPNYPSNNSTAANIVCPSENVTFSCPPLFPNRDFDDVIANGSIYDTGVKAGYPGYTLHILFLENGDRAKVISGIPAEQNNAIDLKERAKAYLHRPYLTTDIGLSYALPFASTDCYYRIGQYLASCDPQYIPLDPEVYDSPLIYTTALKSNVSKEVDTKKILLDKFHEKRKLLRAPDVKSITQTEINFFKKAERNNINKKTFADNKFQRYKNR